jgi:hypothetical protein
MDTNLETNDSTKPLFPESLLVSALGFYQTKQSFESDVTSFISLCQPLPEKEFWKATEDLKKTAASLTQSIGKEFVRRCWVGQTAIPIEKVGSFTKTYESMCSKINSALSRIDTGRTDDPHGDLIDALPMLGVKAFDEILTISSNKEFAEFELKWREATEARLSKRIFDGENYIQMGLSDGLKLYLPSYARECAQNC